VIYMTPWDQIIAGQIVEGIIAGYTNVMGTEIFYALVAFIAFALIYFKTRNFGTVAVTALLVGGAVFTLFPADVQRLAYFFMILGIAGILYSVYKS